MCLCNLVGLWNGPAWGQRYFRTVSAVVMQAFSYVIKGMQPTGGLGLNSAS